MQDAVSVRLLLGGSALFRDRLSEAVDYAEEALAFCEVGAFLSLGPSLCRWALFLAWSYVNMRVPSVHNHKPTNPNPTTQTPPPPPTHTHTETRRQLHGAPLALLRAGGRVRHVRGRLGGRLRPAAEGGAVRFGVFLVFFCGRAVGRPSGCVYEMGWRWRWR